MAATGHQPPNLDLWKMMTSGNCFRRLVDERGSPVLVLGLMGAGKSTVIGIQQGATYQSGQEMVDGRIKKVYRCVQADARCPQTSDGYTSKTLNIGVYVAGSQYGGYSFLDTAGLNEDRTEEHRQWTQWNAATVLSILPKVTSVVVVIDYRSLVAERGNSLRQLAQSLSRIVGVGESSKPFYDSMIFLFTHAYEDGLKATADGVLGIAEKQLTEMEKQLKSMAEIRRSQQPSAQAEMDQDEDKLANYFFLRTLAGARGRIHMCFPDTPNQSVMQRESVRVMIEGSKPICKKDLQLFAASRPTNNLQVLQTLATLVTEPYQALGDRSYTAILRQRADNLSQLKSLFERERDRVCAIQSDWRAVQRDLVNSLVEARDNLHTYKTGVECEKAAKQSSEVKTVICTEEVKLSHPTSGWWALCFLGGGWGWGKQSAHYTFEYDKKWFSDYTLHGGDYTKEVLSCDPEKGKLKIKFVSTPGKDLSVDVKFYRPEKDTDETKRQIETLQSQVEEATRDIEKRDREKISLSTAQSANELLARLMEEKETMERADRDIVMQLDQDAVKASDDFPKVPSEQNVLANIADIFSVLVEQKMLPTDLASSTASAIHDFQKEYTRLHSLLKDLEQSGHGFVSLQKACAGAVPTEDAPPVSPSLQARASCLLGALSEVPVQVQERMLQLLTYLRHHKLATALAVCVYALMLKGFPSNSCQGAMANVLIGFASFVIFSTLVDEGVHNAHTLASAGSQTVNRAVGVMDSRLIAAMARATTLLKQTAEGALTTLKDMGPIVKASVFS